MRIATARSRRSKRGFSIAETTISMAILAIGILGMMAAQGTALHENNQGRHSTGASQVARDQMEALQRLPWTHPDLAVGSTWKTARTTQTSVKGQNGQTGYAEETFNSSHRVLAGPTPDLRRIEVRVNWVEEDAGTGSTNTKQVVISTMRVNY